MKKQLASVLIGLTALGGTAAIAPTLASAQEDPAPTEVQADETGERGRRGHHRGARNLSVVTDILGMTSEELRAELRAGNSLADIAGADTDAVIDALVAAANERLDAKVADGSITAEEAAERAAGIEDKVTEKVNTVRTARGDGEGRRGPGGQAGVAGAGFAGGAADSSAGVSA